MGKNIVSQPLLDIVKRCKEGDHASFRELYDRYKDGIYSTSYRLLGNIEEAEEATQDTFIKIFHSIKKFHGDSSLLTWIYRIAVNTCIDTIRKKKKEHKHISLDDPEITLDIPANTGAPGTVRLIVEHEIEQLPDGCKTVFVLNVIEGFKHREIAEILDISPGTSKSQLALAKARLREKLLPYREVLKDEL